MTAAELMAKLNKDASYVDQAAERDRRVQAAAREATRQEAQITSEIAKAGYKITSVWDLVNNNPHPFLPRPFVGPYERAYPILVRHLRLPHPPGVREGIIRALTVRDGGELVSRALFEQFNIEKDPLLRWLLSNALRMAMPLRERKNHPEIAKAFRDRSAL